jgi:hypothetical protein
MNEIEDLDGYVESLRVTASEAAKQLVFLAKLAADEEADGEAEFTRLKVAAVMKVSERHASARIELAKVLTTRLPLTLQALREGVLDEHRASRVAAATEILSDDLAALVESQLIPEAADWSLRQLNDRLRRAVFLADPAADTARTEARRAARRVHHQALADGGGLLQIQGDVERTRRAFNRVRAVARHLKAVGDDRTVDQLAADVALDCLSGKTSERANVHLWRSRRRRRWAWTKAPETQPAVADSQPSVDWKLAA